MTTKIGPVVDLRNPGRPRLDILKEMMERGEITIEQYEEESRLAGRIAGAFEEYRQSVRSYW